MPARVLGYVNRTAEAAFSGVNRIATNLGSGDDFLGIHAISIGGSLKVNMGAGADTLRIDNTVFDSNVSDNADVFIGGATKVNMGTMPET